MRFDMRKNIFVCLLSVYNLTSLSSQVESYSLVRGVSNLGV